MFININMHSNRCRGGTRPRIKSISKKIVICCHIGACPLMNLMQLKHLNINEIMILLIFVNILTSDNNLCSSRKMSIICLFLFLFYDETNFVHDRAFLLPSSMHQLVGWLFFSPLVPSQRGETIIQLYSFTLFKSSSKLIC